MWELRCMEGARVLQERRCWEERIHVLRVMEGRRSKEQSLGTHREGCGFGARRCRGRRVGPFIFFMKSP